MNPKIHFSKLALIAFLLLLFADFFDRAQYIAAVPKLPVATYIFSAIKYISLALLLFLFSKKINNIEHDFPKPGYYVFMLWCLWCFLTILRGVLSADDYWDWRFLLTDNLLRYSVHFAIVIGFYLVGFRELFSLIVKRLFIFSFALLYFSSGSFDYFFSYVVMPITLIMLALPYMQNRDRIVVLLVALCSLFLAVEFRANALRLAFGFGLLLIFNFRKFIPHSALKGAVVVMMVVPLVFLYFGVTRQFNPFTELTRVSATKHYASGEEENLTADTRTFLYIETLQTLQKRNSFLIGEGGAGSYESVYKFDYLLDMRRYSTEVGFLNVILHSGIVGTILYFVILLLAAFYGVWRSNNWFTRMLGLAIAFRSIMFFIEDPTAFNMSMFFLWVAIGLSFSKTVRAMSDDQISSLFQPKTRRLLT